MEKVWKIVCLCLVVSLLKLCNGLPIRLESNIPEEVSSQLLLEVIVVLLSICTVLLLAGCLCCHRPSGFKEFRNSPVAVSNISNVDNGLVNPSAEGAFTIFAPLGHGNFSSSNDRLRLEEEYSYGDINVSTWFDEGVYDFPRTRLKYIKELGKGWFGSVVEGTAQDPENHTWTSVVVRILDSTASTKEKVFFLNEAEIYRCGNHTNLLKLHGRCLDSEPFLLLQELCPQGDLKGYLLSNKSNHNLLASEYPLVWCCQITSALKFLHEKGLAHSDLACRNCQLTSNLTVKLGDYGLASSKYPEDYYEGIPSISVRWCAPESIRHTSTTIQPERITREANVWSLAVCFWEICECGSKPYSELTDDEVVTLVLGKAHTRLPRPSQIVLYTDYIYRLMQSCWLTPESRPTSTQIYLTLTDLLQVFTVCKSENNGSVADLQGSQESFDMRWNSLKPNISATSAEKSDSKPMSPSLNNLIGSIEDTNRSRSSEEDNAHYTFLPEKSKQKFEFELSSNQVKETLETDSLDDSLVYNMRRSSSSETEEENWKRKIERGAYTEKVRQKSRSVTDLMILTHIDCSESESETPLPSLDHRVNYKNVRLAPKHNLENANYVHGSEGNLLSVQDDFQAELKKLQEEHRDSLFFVPDKYSQTLRDEQVNNNIVIDRNICLGNSSNERFFTELSGASEITPVNQVYNVFNVTVDNLSPIHVVKLNEIINLEESLEFGENKTFVSYEVPKLCDIIQNNSMVANYLDNDRNRYEVGDSNDTVIHEEVPPPSDELKSPINDSNSMSNFDLNSCRDKLSEENSYEVTSFDNKDRIKEESHNSNKDKNTNDQGTSYLRSDSAKDQTNLQQNGNEYPDENHSHIESNSNTQTKHETINSETEQYHFKNEKNSITEIDDKLIVYEQPFCDQPVLNKNITLDFLNAEKELLVEQTLSHTIDDNKSANIKIQENGINKQFSTCDENNSKIDSLDSLENCESSNNSLNDQESNNQIEKTSQKLNDVDNVSPDRVTCPSLEEGLLAEQTSPHPINDNNIENMKIQEKEINKQFSTSDEKMCDKNNSKIDSLDSLENCESYNNSLVNINEDSTKIEENLNDQECNNQIEKTTQKLKDVYNVSPDRVTCPSLEKGLLAEQTSPHPINDNNTENMKIQEKEINKQFSACNENMCDKNNSKIDSLDSLENCESYNNSPVNINEDNTKITKKNELNNQECNNQIERTSQKLNGLDNVSDGGVTCPSSLKDSLESKPIQEDERKDKEQSIELLNVENKELEIELHSEKYDVIKGNDEPIETDILCNSIQNNIKNKSFETENDHKIDNGKEEIIMREKEDTLEDTTKYCQDDSKYKTEVKLSQVPKLIDIIENSDELMDYIITKYKSKVNDDLSTENNSKRHMLEGKIVVDDESKAVEKDCPTVSFDLSDSQDVSNPNSLTHLNAFSSLRTKQKSVDMKASTPIKKPSRVVDEENSDENTNLNYSLETWDNFLEDAIDTQTRNINDQTVVFESLSSEPQSMIFIEGDGPNLTVTPPNSDMEISLEGEDVYSNQTINVESDINEANPCTQDCESLNNTYDVEQLNKTYDVSTLDGSFSMEESATDDQDESGTWESTGGWFLHPQSCGNVSGQITEQKDVKNNDRFGMDDEILAALRGELLAKLPHAQGSSSDKLNENDEEWDPTEKEELFLRYNVYNTPLSPIPEESENEEDSDYVCTATGSPASGASDDWPEKLLENVVPQEIDSQSLKTQGLHHQHTLSQDSCCSNDTLFNLEDMTYVVVDQEEKITDTDGIQKEDNKIKKLEEEQIKKEAIDYFKLGTVVGMPLESPVTDLDSPLEPTIDKSHVADFLIKEREHSEMVSVVVTEPVEENASESNSSQLNKTTAPLPSPDDHPWKQLSDSLLKKGLLDADHIYENTEVKKGEDDDVKSHLYINLSAEQGEEQPAKSPVYTNLNSEEILPSYVNVIGDDSLVYENLDSASEMVNEADYVNITNRENAKMNAGFERTEQPDEAENPEYVDIEDCLALRNEEEQDDQLFGVLTDIRFSGPGESHLMSTSFSESNDIQNEQDWESGSDTRSSSSGEFIWREGEHEESLKALQALPQDMLDDIEPNRGEKEETSSDDTCSDEDAECPEFIPSAWDKYATPTKSALRSPEKTLEKEEKKKGVWFKKQRYHCVYEYPREPDSPVLQSFDLWNNPPPATSYPEWYFDIDSNNEFNDYTTTTNFSDGDTLPTEFNTTSFNNEFFVTGSATPFDMMTSTSSQFFPGSDHWSELSKLNENTTPDSGVEDVTPGSIDRVEFVNLEPSSNVPSLKLLAEVEYARLKQKNKENTANEILGGLRHTRDKLKLDLPSSPNTFSSNKTFSLEPNIEPVVLRERPAFTTFGKSRFLVQHVDTPDRELTGTNVCFEALPYKPPEKKEPESKTKKTKKEEEKGEASLLDSADEDSGIESSTLERKSSDVGKLIVDL